MPEVGRNSPHVFGFSCVCGRGVAAGIAHVFGFSRVSGRGVASPTISACPQK